MGKFLTDLQKKMLKEIGETELSTYFTWSGGTALSYYYLQHRLSFDLDFLSKELFPDEYLLSQIKKISENLKIKKIEEQKKFNRQEFLLQKDGKILRIEFVFYPFPDIKKPKIIKEFNIKIDSIEDILTNKAHALFERAEPKDVFDFYCILQKYKIKFISIFKLVRKKFGTEIDPVLFASKILEGTDRLVVLKPLIQKKELYQPGKIKKYFEKEVQKYLIKKIN